jgi:hypothetical protein
VNFEFPLVPRGTQLQSIVSSPNEIPLYAELADEAYFRLSSAELGLGRPEEFPDFAIRLLESGFETRELLSLAGSSSGDHPQELRDSARRAFVSLGWPVPPVGVELLDMARSYCRGIILNAIDPFSGLNYMLRIWQMSDYDPVYLEWTDLDDSIALLEGGHGGLDPFYELTESSIPDTIRQLAADFLMRTNKT